jgi:hypothetical protein
VDKNADGVVDFKEFEEAWEKPGGGGNTRGSQAWTARIQAEMNAVEAALTPSVRSGGGERGGEQGVCKAVLVISGNVEVLPCPLPYIAGTWSIQGLVLADGA